MNTVHFIAPPRCCTKAGLKPTKLVLPALEQALALRQPALGLIIHADRDSQYTSAACRARIN